MNILRVALTIYLACSLVTFVTLLYLRFQKGKWPLGRPLVAVALWPLLVLLFLDALVNKFWRKPIPRLEASNFNLEARVEHSIAALKIASELDANEIETCRRNLAEFQPGAYRTIHSADLRPALEGYWKNKTDPFEYRRALVVGAAGRREWKTIPGTVRFSVPQRAGWLIAMSNDFVKAIECIDRKLQGRILEALAEISKDPITVKGDTMKPLSRELDGLWRYRLGDYRLVYQPLPERMEILLVNFASRGSVYG
jgi:mRNA interferase RelE/StbE